MTAFLASVGLGYVGLVLFLIQSHNEAQRRTDEMTRRLLNGHWTDFGRYLATPVRPSDEEPDR